MFPVVVVTRHFDKTGTLMQEPGILGWNVFREESS